MTSHFSRVVLRRGVSSIVDGPFGSNIASEHYVEKGARVVRLGNIGAMKFRDGDCAFVSLHHFEGLRRHSVVAGDVLVAGLGDDNNAVGRACIAPHGIEPAIVKADCFRLRTRPSIFLPRFVAWYLNSSIANHLVQVESRGATRVRATPEAIQRIEIPRPAIDVQQRIVEFLDDQAARIDEIVSARQEQQLKAVEMRRSAIDALLIANPCVRALATVTDPMRPIQYGIVLPGPDFPGGVPIVKGGDIASGRLRRGELKCTDPKIEARYVRSRLKIQDIVIAIRGSVGEVDFVPRAGEGANLTQDVARIAPHGVDPRWLRWVLESPTVQADIRSRVTGATVTGINIEDLRRVRVPDVSQSQQELLGRSAEMIANRAAEQEHSLRRSVGLFRTLKESLITAAVTGEFDVTSADGSRVPV